MQCAVVLRSRGFPAAALKARSALHETTQEPALTVCVDCPIGSPLRGLEQLRVHALAATRKYCDEGERKIVGLVTFNAIKRDIQCNRTARNGLRGLICGGDVMTLVAELPLIHLESLQSLSAPDSHAMFQGTGLPTARCRETRVRSDGG